MAGNPWFHNEFGAWCPSCGELISGEDAEFADCPACGFPDDIEAVAQYHCGDDDDGDSYDWRRDSARDDRDIHGIGEKA